MLDPLLAYHDWVGRYMVDQPIVINDAPCTMTGRTDLDRVPFGSKRKVKGYDKPIGGERVIYPLFSLISMAYMPIPELRKTPTKKAKKTKVVKRKPRSGPLPVRMTSGIIVANADGVVLSQRIELPERARGRVILHCLPGEHQPHGTVKPILADLARGWSPRPPYLCVVFSDGNDKHLHNWRFSTDTRLEICGDPSMAGSIDLVRVRRLFQSGVPAEVLLKASALFSSDTNGDAEAREWLKLIDRHPMLVDLIDLLPSSRSMDFRILRYVVETDQEVARLARQRERQQQEMAAC